MSSEKKGEKKLLQWAAHDVENGVRNHDLTQFQRHLINAFHFTPTDFVYSALAHEQLKSEKTVAERREGKWRRLIKFNYDCKVQWEGNSSETLSGVLKFSVENEIQLKAEETGLVGGTWAGGHATKFFSCERLESWRGFNNMFEFTIYIDIDQGRKCV